MRITLLLIALLPWPLAAHADPASAGPGRIDYPTVAAALQDLASQDGNGTVVVHSDGWTIVNQPMASAQWSFTPSGHAAHPALVRRVIRRGPNGAVAVETTALCEAPQAACDQLQAEFATLNDRIGQAVKARARPATP